MAHKITADCVACGSCQSECPVQAIIAGDTRYKIDAKVCTDCGSCEQACPVNAIVSE